jgi:hypothetical protein
MDNMRTLNARSFDPSSPLLELVANSSNQGNQSVNIMLQNLEMAKVLEGRSIRLALGVVSAILAIYVIYRIWIDNWKAAVSSYRKQQR